MTIFNKNFLSHSLQIVPRGAGSPSFRIAIGNYLVLVKQSLHTMFAQNSHTLVSFVLIYATLQEVHLGFGFV